MQTGLPARTDPSVCVSLPFAGSSSNVTIESLSSFAAKRRRRIGSMAKKRGVFPLLGCHPIDVNRPSAAPTAKIAILSCPRFVIIAGERYGVGSSRDWAAKGASLLGVRAVLALGFERFQPLESPLRLHREQSPQCLSLGPGDMVEIEAWPDQILPHTAVVVHIRRLKGESETFQAIAAIETSLEVDILREGGILPLILKRAVAHKAGVRRSIEE